MKFKFKKVNQGRVREAIKADERIPEVTEEMECDFYCREYRATGVGAQMRWNFRYSDDRHTCYPFIQVTASMRYDPDDVWGQIFLWDGVVTVRLVHGKDPDDRNCKSYEIQLQEAVLHEILETA